MEISFFFSSRRRHTRYIGDWSSDVCSSDVSQEAARTVKLLGLGKWTGLAAEGNHGHVHLAAPTSDALLLVVRDRAVPMGRLAVIAQRAALAARRWLEAHA